jgi:N6-adenosine-specific RNA methylase IME4/ParB-like chromosome segregation protein Spo0J
MDSSTTQTTPSHRPAAELRLHPSCAEVPVMAEAEYESFRADIRERGILVPLEISTEGIVLDGRHRLRAASQLHLKTVPVRIVTPADEHEHVLLAALQRRHLSASQRAALTVELDWYREAKAQAEQNRLANLTSSENKPPLPARGERTRELGARLAGVSTRTLQDASTVHEHDPQLFEQVKRGVVPVHRAARKVRRAQRDASLPSAPPLPEGPFELIYADPPWQLGNPNGAHAPENHYPTLPNDEIANLRVPAAPSAVLFLWAVNCRLPQAFEVMRAWGFAYTTNLAWVKPSIGLGNWTRNRHELLLVGRRGNVALPDPEDRPDSVIEAKRGRHSEKPARVYELLERMYPQKSKLELFARRARHGWAAWGNQVES